MSSLSRFGVSLEKTLLQGFDRLVKKKKCANRSEAFRDLIRQQLVEKEWQHGSRVAGAITLIYDHHRHELGDKLTHIQHNFQGLIISTQHIHLDHHNCLEIIAVKGSPQKVQRLADMLRSVRGVKHGTLSMSTTGKDIK